jgi:hypothetical protein
MIGKLSALDARTDKWLHIGLHCDDVPLQAGEWGVSNLTSSQAQPSVVGKERTAIPQHTKHIGLFLCPLPKILYTGLLKTIKT